METTTKILDRIGRDKAARALSLTKGSISNTTSSGVFPASWYSVMQKLARREGFKISDDLFAFKESKDASQRHI